VIEKKLLHEHELIFVLFKYTFVNATTFRDINIARHIFYIRFTVY